MKIIDCREPEAAAELAELNERTAFPENVERSVAEMLSNIRTNGDDAIIEYAAKFDGAALTPDQFRVSDEEIAAAADEVDPAVTEAIQLAHENILAFTEQRIPQDWSFSPRQGVTLGERFVPLDRIAAYIPGGAAPLVSTTLHTITMAAAVGVPEIVVITPPGPSGRVNPAILHAAKVAGATEVYRLGGVYGVGAVAYGTPTVKKVQKIVGPGNAYVTAAKRQVYGHVALDMVAGPSEILVIADDTARADFIAADMLSQMEHGSGCEQAVCVTTSDRLIDELPTELLCQAGDRLRQETIFTVMEKGAFIIRVNNTDEAVKVASDYAPEHLEIMTADADDIAKKIKCAGATFIGQWTPEPVGDFTAGPSHVLPTGGAARFFNGLTVDQFVRRISQVKYDQEALKREAAALAAFGRTEELDAHARSVSIRLD